ncbi:zeta toxin family protein [Variovorax paradoxus]|nr:zeta toxin family protein [Variovorax paradoxus]
MRDDSDPNRDTAIFLTGIPGAGKTSAVIGSGFPANARVLFEGQLNRPEPTMEKIQAALDAGLTPVIIAVRVTPELALRRTFQRFEEYGRGAGINVMADIQAGLPDGLRKVHDRFGDAVQLTVLDNRFPGQRKALQGGNISNNSPRKETMNASHNASAPSSTDIATKEKSPKPATAKPAETHPSQPLEEWIEKVVDKTNEMATNEAARKEVAKRLT